MPTTPSSSTTLAPKGRCIVVFGTKGGVGKTVFATNIAVGLAMRVKQPVCLIDADLTGVGDVAKILKVSAPRTLADLMPILRRNPDPRALSLEGVIAPHMSGVHVLTCVSHPRQVSQLDPALLGSLFLELKRRYAYVIIDGGKVFSEPLIAAFDASNLILLVATPDVVTLYQTKWALGLVQSLLFPPEMVKVVLNRAESRGSVDIKDVRAAIPCEVIGEIPSDGHVVGTSMNQGAPLVTMYRSTRVAEAYLRLVEELVTELDLYVAHQDIPRHHRDPAAAEALATPTWRATMFPSEDGQGEERTDDILLMKRRIHDQLLEHLDLKKLDLTTLTDPAKLSKLRQKVEPIIAGLLAKEMGGIVSSHEVRTKLVKEIADEAMGLGPLEELLADPEVTDILVNNKDHIYVERHGKLELTAKKFVSNDQVRAVIERIVAPLGRRIDEANPMVDARLPDGSRVNAIVPPLAIHGPTLSIRKFGRTCHTLEDLIRFGSLSPAMAQFIKACVLARKNLIISGGTGSGKTTLLNVVSAFILEDERIITIEDAAELKLAQAHWVSLEARPSNVEGKGEITIRELFRNALRMRPDRIIIGECRSAETLDMLQAMNTGHDGSMTTVHANSPRDVLSRLDSMVLMSNVELPIHAIREMVASAIDVIIHTARLSDGSRKITAISELMGLSGDTDIAFQDLFAFQQTGIAPDGTVLGEYLPSGKLPSFFQELKMKGISLEESVFSLR